LFQEVAVSSTLTAPHDPFGVRSPGPTGGSRVRASRRLVALAQSRCRYCCVVPKRPLASHARLRLRMRRHGPTSSAPMNGAGARDDVAGLLAYEPGATTTQWARAVKPMDEVEDALFEYIQRNLMTGAVDHVLTEIRRQI